MNAKHHCELTKPISKTGLTVLPPNATCWQRTRRSMLRLIVVSEFNPRSRLYLRSSTAIDLEKHRHIEAGYYYIIHPFSLFRTMWEWWMWFVMLTSLFAIPYSVAFSTELRWGAHRHNDQVMLTLRFAFQLIYLLDIVLYFLTGFHHPATKEIVLEPSRIAVHYIRGLFFFDLLSSMPLEFLFMYLMTEDSSQEVTLLLNFIELCLVLKVVRIRLLLEYTGRILQVLDVGDMSVRLIKLALLGCMIVHWMACAHIMTPIVVWQDVNHIPDRSWIKRFGVVDMKPFEQYANSLFRAVSNTAFLGFGHEDPEALEDAMMSVVNVVAGAIFMTYAFVVVMSIRMMQNAPAIKYQEMMNELQEYMRHKQLPMFLQERLIMYHEFRFQKQYFQENVILRTLSESLRREISMYSCHRLIASVDLFRNLPRTVVSSVVGALKGEIFLPNDIIVKAGFPGEGMYFVGTGTVAMLTATGLEVCHLQDGDYFGEVALLSEDGRHVASMVAVDLCEVFRLAQADFRRLILGHPELFRRAQDVALRRVDQLHDIEERNERLMLDKSMRAWQEEFIEQWRPPRNPWTERLWWRCCRPRQPDDAVSW